jgi:hypothetical protein
MLSVKFNPFMQKDVMPRDVMLRVVMLRIINMCIIMERIMVMLDAGFYIVIMLNVDMLSEYSFLKYS